MSPDKYYAPEISPFDRERQDNLARLQRNSKFKMFFAGLIFATLSFMGTHIIDTRYLWLKVSEVVALVLLFFAGVILLLQLAEYRINNDVLNKFQRCFLKNIFMVEKWYWICFVIGMGSLISNRILLMFFN